MAFMETKIDFGEGHQHPLGRVLGKRNANPFVVVVAVAGTRPAADAVHVHPVEQDRGAQYRRPDGGRGAATGRRRRPVPHGAVAGRLRGRPAAGHALHLRRLLRLSRLGGGPSRHLRQTGPLPSTFTEFYLVLPRFT